jgi:hypothetical protein
VAAAASAAYPDRDTAKVQMNAAVMNRVKVCIIRT